MFSNFAKSAFRFGKRDDSISQDLHSLMSFRGNAFFQGMVVFIFIVLIFYAMYNTVVGLWTAAVFDLGNSVLMIVIYTLCFKGRFLTAKIIFLGALNGLLLCFALSYPTEVGLYLIYLPMVAFAMAIFQNDSKVYRYVFSAVSLTLMCVILFFRPDILPVVDIPPDMIYSTFLVNLSASVVVLFITLNYLLFVIDSTDKVILGINYELKMRNDALNISNDKLNKFTYSVSHDLRAPLSSIKGLSTLGMYDSNSDAMMDYFQKISQSADKLDDFIKRSLSYYKNQECALSEVNIKVMIQELIRNFRFMDNASRISFKLDGYPKELICLVDEMLLRSVVSNLVSNAIKYHDPLKERQFIHIEVTYDKSILGLKIIDNGKGIDKMHLDKLFQLFYTAGSTDNKSTGVGLYLVKDAVTKMNGVINVQSDIHNGTVFLVQLPAKLVDKNSGVTTLVKMPISSN
jgi:signal transduction histidine kinase